MGIWAAVKYALNSTLGTSSFSPIDKIVNRLWGGVQTFTTDGTFTVPENVTKILVTACGGGEGGGKSYSSGSWSYEAMGGEGAECIIREPFSVTPLQQIPIKIGIGGQPLNTSSDDTRNSSGDPGGSTIIGNLVTLIGGNSTLGTPRIGGGRRGSGRQERRGSDGYTLAEPSNGADGVRGAGGRCSVYYGGGGGSYGNGGTAGKENSVGYGGGGAGNQKGGDGIVIIEW